ncbi:MAG: hypothetical protein WA183_01225 [Chthoniobacterales bacterium]
MRSRLLLGLVVVFAVGCGGQSLAPVSGKVTLHGVPLIGATVSFQPIAPEGSIDAGPGSTGKTNADGEYTLTAATGQPGAVPGQHRVIITLLQTVPGTGDQRHVRLMNQVPPQYGADGNMKREVVAGTNNVLDFPLTSP